MGAFVFNPTALACCPTFHILFKLVSYIKLVFAFLSRFVKGWSEFIVCPVLGAIIIPDIISLQL